MVSCSLLHRTLVGIGKCNARVYDVFQIFRREFSLLGHTLEVELGMLTLGIAIELELQRWLPKYAAY